MSVVTELLLENLESSEGRITTIGHVFREGDIPAGTSINATLDDADVPVQLDVKATWPDGSVKHAVLSFENPVEAGSGTLVLGHAETPPDAAPIDVTAQALAQDFSFIVEIDGETFDVASHLADGDPWLSGPLASEVRVSTTLGNGLDVRVDVRATADGTFHTSVVVGNDNIETTGLDAKTYAVSLTQNGEIVYENAALTQPHFTVWREAFSTESAPNTAHAVYDLDYLRQTTLLPSVDDTIVLNDSTAYADTLSHENASFDPLELGGIDNVGGIDDDRGRTGITPSYGLITDDQHSYLVTQSAEARGAMLALTDQYGAFSNYYRNPETGEAYFLEDTDSNSFSTGIGKDLPGTDGVIDLLNDGLAQRNSFSHKPSEYYLSYLVTGDRYYADGLAHEAGSSLLLWANATYLTEDGHVNFGSQLREQAWVLRDLFYAASLAPDGSHAAEVLNSRLDAALQDYVDFYVNAETSLTSELGTNLTGERAAARFIGGDLEGALQSYNGTSVDRPYWQDWFAMVVGQIAQSGNENAIVLGRWMAGFGAERFLQDDFDPNHSLFSILDYPVSGGSRDLAVDTTWQQLNDAATAVGGVGPDANPWVEGDNSFFAAAAWGGAAAAFSGVRDARYAEALLWMTTQLTDSYVASLFEGGAVPQFGVPVTFDDYSIAGVNDRTVGTALGDEIIDGNGNRLIHSGGGDDLIHTGDGSHLVDGGDGGDTITGGEGEDWLFGGSGEDTLAGGGGINYLQGDRFDADFGRYSDTFLFSGGLGETTIGDFTIGEDLLFFDAIGDFSNLEDFQSQFVQDGEDAVLDLGSFGRLTLTGVDHSTLSSVDFVITAQTTIVDAADLYSWESYTNILDTVTGQFLSQERLFDNGDIHTTLYGANGMRESFTFEDISGSRSWETYTNTYDNVNGQITGQELLFDNDNVTSRTYIDGIIASNVTNEADGDTRTTLYDANGARESFALEDGSESRSWEVYTNTYDSISGLITAQEFVYDNGNVTNRVYIDGVISSNVVSEVDGDTLTTLYNEAGVRESFTFEDFSNTRNWETYVNTYDGDSGEIVTQQRLFDNGDTRSQVYIDGVISSSITNQTDGDVRTTFYDPNGARESLILVDVSDSQAWEISTRTYDTVSGLITEQELLYDNGNIASRTFGAGVIAHSVTHEVDGDIHTTLYDANGVRESFTFEDGSESRAWESYTNTYDNVSGQIRAQEYLYDNGTAVSRTYVDDALVSSALIEVDQDVLTTLYNPDGVRASFTFEDGSQSRDWASYTNTYDVVSGQITAQELLYDNGDRRDQAYVDGVLVDTVFTPASETPDDTDNQRPAQLPFESDISETIMGSGSLFGTDASETLIPTSSNVQVHGNAGDDVFQLDTDWVVAFGGSGDDVFYLQGQNQRATGDVGSDAFVIAGPLVGSVIHDFDAADDTLYFANGVGGIVDFEDFSASVEQADGDVIISTAQGQVQLENVDLNSLNESNIQFFQNDVARAGTLNVPETGEAITGSGWLTGSDENDLILSGGGNIRVTGGFGDDHLIAEHWGVRLLGGSGKDLLEARDFDGLLFGGSGADQFYYANHIDGLIGDFQSGIDRVVLNGNLGYETTEAAFSALSDTVDGAVLAGANGDSLLFANVMRDQLDESDFLIL